MTNTTSKSETGTCQICERACKLKDALAGKLRKLGEELRAITREIERQDARIAAWRAAH